MCALPHTAIFCQVLDLRPKKLTLRAQQRSDELGQHTQASQCKEILLCLFDFVCTTVALWFWFHATHITPQDAK